MPTTTTMSDESDVAFLITAEPTGANNPPPTSTYIMASDHPHVLVRDRAICITWSRWQL